MKLSPGLRALRAASPSPSPGATPVARQSRFHGVPRTSLSLGLPLEQSP